MTESMAAFSDAVAERYRVLREIGRGGMSTVYAAEDLKHDRHVAVKVLRGELAASIGAERFLREIGIAARLQHPHVLPLLDSGTAAGHLFYVMPLVTGESLRERLVREAPLPLSVAVRILVDTADALRYAHEQGIVHRDIKPENVMLSGRHALVMDFGVARALGRGESDGKHTTVGVALGTPAYMAPEQAAADPTVDHRADLYALGVVGFEMLTGRPPFTGESSQAILAAHVTEAPPALGDLRSDLPATLVDVIMRLLAKKPAERPQSAAELIDLLEPFAVSSGSLTPVASVAVARARRRRRIAALAVVAIAVVTAVAVASRGEREALRPGVTRQLTFASGLELDPVLSPDGRWLAYSAGQNGRMRVYVRQLSEGNPIPIAEGLEGNQRSPKWSPDGERIVLAAAGSLWIAPASGGTPRLLVEGTRAQPAGNPAWAPDGGRLAFTLGGTIEILEIDAPDRRTTLVSDTDPHSLGWSPDGGLLAYVAGNSPFSLSETELGNVAPALIRIVPFSGGEPISLSPADGMSLSPAWLPDSHSLLYISDRDGVRDIWRQRVGRRGGPDGAAERLTTGLGAHSLSVSPDGQRVSYSVFNHSANVWAVELPLRGATSVRAAAQITSGSQIIEDLDVLAGGRWLLFDSNRSGNQDLYLMTLPDGEPFQLTDEPADDFGPAWSPDGREIAFYSMRNGARNIYVMSNDGRHLTRVTQGPGQDTQPRWSPDGTSLVFNRTEPSGRLRPFVVTRKADSIWGEPEPLMEASAGAAAWSPDGRWIAVLSAEGAIELIPAQGGEARIVLQPGQVGGAELRRPYWLDAETLLAREIQPGGQGALWEVALAGGAPRQLVVFDDASRPVFRDDYVSDGDRLYFPVSVLESDIWSMELERGRN